MRAGIVTALVALCLPATTFVTSLCLSNGTGLLVLDGEKVSSPLLRDADSIELENDQYQLAFCVEKAIHLSSYEERLYISPPLATSFDTQFVSQANLHLPRLSNEWDTMHSNDASHVELLDGGSMPIPAKLDILSITFTAKIVDYEMETEHCSKATKHASLPQFATMMADGSSLLSRVSGLGRVPPQSQTLTEQRLKYWFRQAGAQTRSSFLQWAERQPPS